MLFLLNFQTPRFSLSAGGLVVTLLFLPVGSTVAFTTYIPRFDEKGKSPDLLLHSPSPVSPFPLPTY